MATCFLQRKITINNLTSIPLWDNTAQQGGFTLNLDLSKYTVITMYSPGWTSNACVTTKVGSSGTLGSLQPDRTRYRSFSISNTGITFGSASYYYNGVAFAAESHRLIICAGFKD